MEEVREGDSETVSNAEVIVQSENQQLRAEVEALKQQLLEIKTLITSQTISQAQIPQIIPVNNPTNSVIFQTDLPSETSSFPLFSTGNEGVPTDRQIDAIQTIQASNQGLEAVSSVLADLKIKFRNLTKQEFKVFSAIYIFSQNQQVDYRIISEKLKLTEGSIRDYVMKMERKGIPIAKEKVNNKKILLYIRPEVKQLMPLEAIMNVREPIFR
jgi:predicted XRE-type DNA-binding protein